MADPSPQGRANQPNRSPAPSISDVAREAGVSASTVSRVINNPSLVSGATADRVRAAIARLDFKPNVFAQGLTTRRSRILGLAVPDLHGDFYSVLLKAADQAAHKAGYHLVVMTEGDEGMFELPPGLAAGFALVLTEPNDRLVGRFRVNGTPTVLVDAVPNDGLDCVVLDNEAGARAAALLLLKHAPPDRCWFVGGPERNFDSRARAGAFQRVLGERGERNPESRVRFGAYSVEWGREWAGRAIREGALHGAAVLAANDEIAWGIVTSAHGAGMSVPRDLRVIGFDDTRLASLVIPRLTSVRLPISELGSAAIELLLARLERPDDPPRHVSLPARLVIRESCEA